VLGTTIPAPDASFTTSFVEDLYVVMNDTSADDGDIVSSWLWTFKETGQTDVTSSYQNPNHMFYSGSSALHRVCLTASNVGGSSPEVCQDLSLTAESSTTLNSGGLDLDGDGTDELTIASGSCGNNPYHFDFAAGIDHENPSKLYSTVSFSDVTGSAQTGARIVPFVPTVIVIRPLSEISVRLSLSLRLMAATTSFGHPTVIAEACVLFINH